MVQDLIEADEDEVAFGMEEFRIGGRGGSRWAGRRSGRGCGSVIGRGSGGVEVMEDVGGMTTGNEDLSMVKGRDIASDLIGDATDNACNNRINLHRLCQFRNSIYICYITIGDFVR